MKTAATECQENNPSDDEDDFADILYEVEGDLSGLEGEQDSKTNDNCESVSDDSTGESDFESDDSDLIVRL